jgi:hypothetical protein
MFGLTCCRFRVIRSLAAGVVAVFVVGAVGLGFARADDESGRKLSGSTVGEKPTGRLEGRIKLPERPKVKLPDFALTAIGTIGTQIPKVRLKSISLLVWSAKDPIAEAEIDEDGRFSFESVPAGVVRLQPNFVVAWSETPAEAERKFSLGASFTLHTTVRAGKTTEVAFFGRGRLVTGKIDLPEGIKPQDAAVRLTMIEPPSRAMWGRLDRPRPTPLAVAYGMVTPDRELASELDANGRFRVEGVPEGTYRLHVTIRGQNEPVQVWFRGYAAGQSEWVKNGIFSAPLMKDGTSDVPLDLGAPRFERLPKAG